jgi:nicotinate-nucleotide adenylyltransferase
MTSMAQSAAGALGVFGGTFNPIHVGHLRAAEEIVEALGLAKLLFVPSARPPHKNAEGDDVIAPAADRLAWVRLAVAGNPRFEADAIEVERAGPSFLVETLRSLGERTAPEKPVFVVGRDAFQEMGDWREPRTLFQLAHFVVMTRPPLQDGTLADWLPECVRDDIQLAADGLSGRHRSAGSWVQLLGITALDVSASAIRQRLREGRSTRYLMPDAVHRAVQANGCYRPQSPSGDPTSAGSPNNNPSPQELPA